ncbi:MAG TPA: FAD-dependent monooxygenase [Pilimelia sp.]|nr:FAD-dependent monooxygenase [Pilimelia sp.]
MGAPAGRAVAIVIGAGIAGLAVGRMLADRFARVVLLDRDRLPDTASPRRGAPQTHHAHVLLAAGQRALEQLFPGLHDELVRAGAVPFDPGTDLRFYRYGAVWPAAPAGLRLVSMSRPLLELTLRRRVVALPNVAVRDQVAVAGLTGEDHRVTGVVLDGGEVLPADLVVDCSGRGSRSDRWLSGLGLPAPACLEVKVGIRYATRLYRRKPGDLPDGVGAFVLPTPPHERRVGLILPIEDDRWLVGLGGWHGDQAPADDEGFLRHAQSLPHPAIGTVMARSEPLTDIVSYQFPTSRRRRFERLRTVPAGYLAVGDSMCSFNPVYGQGMTCAALAALALGRTLDRHGDITAAVAREFYRAAAEIVAVPWRFAVGADFAYPQTTGPKPAGLALLNAYSRRLQLVARVDPGVRRTFTAVQHLVTPPSALFTPRMIGTVLRGPRRG